MIKELTIEKASLLEIWETKSLGEICEMIKRGSQPKYTESADGEIVLNQKCIRDHKINLSVARKHDTSKKTINKERYIQLGDGLINSTGTGTLGRVAQVRELNFSAFVDTHITIVRPIKNLFFLDFFGWMLIHIEKEIEGLGEGASGQTELSRKIVESINVSFPSSKDQQKQIVAILDKAFAAIDIAKANAEQNLLNAKELFESYLQNIFENKGDDWEEKVFDNVIASSQIGIVRNSKQQSSENPFRYFKMNNILNNNGINDVAYKYIEASADEVEKYRLYKNDFLFNTRNSLELVGKSCLYLSENKELTLFNNNILRVTFRVFLLPQFVAYAFSSKTIKDSLELIKSGTTGVSGIYYKNLKNLKIPFPLIEKQQIIVQKLDALSTETKKLEAIYTQKIADLEEMKKSVLQKAFSGQLSEL